MQCPHTTRLKKMLNGTEQSASHADYAHLRSCQTCRSEIRKLAATSPGAINLASLVLGMDCPDYETLSALVDSDFSSSASSLKTLQAHINSCEACARDIAWIKEMRSKAALREPVTLRPGLTLRGATPWNRVLKRAVAAATLAGAAAALALTIVSSLTTPPRTTTVTAVPHRRTPGPASVPSSAPTLAQSPPGQRVSGQKQAKPESSPYNVVLKDGQYQIAKRNGNFVVLKGGNPIVVPASLLAKMAQKLCTGKVTLSFPVVASISSTRVRGDDYVPPPLAPKPISPVSKTVVYDKPTLSWSTVELGRSYKVVIRDTQGDIVREHITTGQSYTVGSPLQRGRIYVWQVGVRFTDDDQWTMSRAARFRVLSSEEYAHVSNAARAMPGSHLALGVAYESVGLSEEAANEYRMLRRTNPNIRL